MTAPRSLAWHGLPAGDIVCSVRPIVQSSLVLIESEWLSEGSSEAWVPLLGSLSSCGPA